MSFSQKNKAGKLSYVLAHNDYIHLKCTLTNKDYTNYMKVSQKHKTHSYILAHNDNVHLKCTLKNKNHTSYEKSIIPKESQLCQFHKNIGHEKSVYIMYILNAPQQTNITHLIQNQSIQKSQNYENFTKT